MNGNNRLSIDDIYDDLAAVHVKALNARLGLLAYLIANAVEEAEKIRGEYEADVPPISNP